MSRKHLEEEGASLSISDMELCGRTIVKDIFLARARQRLIFSQCHLCEHTHTHIAKHFRLTVDKLLCLFFSRFNHELPGTVIS